MNAKDAETLIQHDDRQAELTDECGFCGTSRWEARNSNYRGCRFCRRSSGPAHEAMTAIGMGKLSEEYCGPSRPPMTDEEFINFMRGTK